MKNSIIRLFTAMLLGMSMCSCLQNYLPQTGGATAGQVAQGSKIGLVNGLTQYLNTAYSGYDYDATGVVTAIGYPEHITWHGVMTADMPMRSDGYDYWTAYSECKYIGSTAYQSYYFWYYCKILFMTSNIIRQCNPDNPDDAFFLANGHAFRAYFNLEMARMYEYRKTGTSLDAQYYESLKGLTMPLVNENTTEDMAKENPRAPYYEMYRFILNDLNLAEQAMLRAQDAPATKNYASLGMIYGNAARFWMELGSRFERHPSDLAEQIAHDGDKWPFLGEGYQDLPPIGIKSANEAFAKAAEYARKAIGCGYTPLSEAQWYDKQTGFNTVNNAWIWAIMMSSSDYFVTSGDWMSWISFMSPEASWGIANPEYKGQFMIDARLFSQIGGGDWRRGTWIAPEDYPKFDDWSVITEEDEAPFKAIFEEKYAPHTNLTYAQWRENGVQPYVGLKFKPGSGNTAASTTGNRADIPLMRVEEMYFIEAEALAHTQGLAAGITALESFMNTYRYTDGTYVCDAPTLRIFEMELLRQKRVEFWGEGITLFDHQRLGMPIVRGYEGSNHKPGCQYNSLDGYAAPWPILFIPISEQKQNTSLLLNPDFTDMMKELKFQ